jgi:periplasmic divalent cation tolerance protein
MSEQQADRSRDEEVLLVMSNLPDAASAQSLAEVLVEQRLAACVNIMAPCRSVYRWRGRIEQAGEVPVLMKTTRARYAALEACIRARHPYELPEVIAVPVQCGLAEYLLWVGTETSE